MRVTGVASFRYNMRFCTNLSLSAQGLTPSLLFVLPLSWLIGSSVGSSLGGSLGARWAAWWGACLVPRAVPFFGWN